MSRPALALRALPLLVSALLANGAQAGNSAPSTEDLLKRIEQLEARLGSMDQELAAEKQKSKDMEAALASDRLSDNEPELATRLKDVEKRASNAQQLARKIEVLDGITASLDVLAVGQSINSGSSVSGGDEGELNYRADAAVSLPGGEIGRSSGSIFAHVRIGQGEGVGRDLAGGFSNPNASAFHEEGGKAILAQLWYQLDVPLGAVAGGLEPKQQLQVNFGKMDPFLFFDQNSIADDESSRFMNSAFVHNPLLDAGGDIGVDDYGFTPGLRAAYLNEESSPEWWQASIALFGAGDGAAFEDSLSDPMVIAQIETGVKLMGGLDGNYRAYVWSNPQASQFNDGLIGETHNGWGVSADQRLGDGITLFGRYGSSTKGQVKFDQALTLGAEFAGLYWGRSGDGLGLAWGWLEPSDDYVAANPGWDDAEQPLELYYRWRFNDQVALSPSLQWVRNPAGDGSADDGFYFGLRGTAAF